MTPLMLRQIWSLVDKTQTHVLLNMDDTSLVQWLLRQVGADGSLNQDETSVLSDYIHSKLPLIRDLADERRSCWQQVH
ncbi:MAG: hypothetical protein F6K19_23810 [Cyanothece sp. SIO1E1]|nr:hypothetical protein [Cyanothece sp. SIO1E1]